MPTDDYGFRADIVIDPNAHVARMTGGPLYEPAINRTSEFVRRKIEAIYPYDPKAASEILLDYYNDINPNYAIAVKQTKTTEQALYAHVKECVDSKIHLWIPCGLKTINLELIQKLKAKWDVKLSPVTFTQIDMDNNIIGTFRTRNSVCIGSKYLLLLSKIPEPSSSGVAHINQYNTPMKSRPGDKHRYPIRRPPIRIFGEDEKRICVMDLEDPKELVRLMCLQATSRKGVDMVIDALLTSDFPTRINRIPITTKELMNTNMIIQVFNHMLATMGVEISPHSANYLPDDKKE